MSEKTDKKLRIRVAGVGGAGIAALECFAQAKTGATTIAVDTDAAALENSKAKYTLCLGEAPSSQSGTGGDIEEAKKAAAKHGAQLEKISENADVLIIFAGFGKGTGSVIAPLISKLAPANTLTLAFCIMPMALEGATPNKLATLSLNYMRRHCNAAFELPNDVILSSQNASVKEAFCAANKTVAQSAAQIVKMLGGTGIVNIGISTLKNIFPRKSSRAFIGFASGGDVPKAVHDLKTSPLMGGISERGNMLASIVCGSGFGMNKMQLLIETAALELNVSGRVAFGVTEDESLGDGFEVCCMGVEKDVPRQEPASPATTANAESKTSASQPKAHAAGEPSSEPSEEPSVSGNAADSANRHSATTVPEQSAHTPQTAAASAPSEPVPVEEAPAKKRKRGFFGFGRKKEEKAHKTDQTEFGFMDISQQRGWFANTKPNMRRGEDLDVPTYMRKGIKIDL